LMLLFESMAATDTPAPKAPFAACTNNHRHCVNKQGTNFIIPWHLWIIFMIFLPNPL
jgi:hypothetical protein